LLSNSPQELLNTPPLPHNKKIATIEIRPNETGTYAGMLLKELAVSSNEIRRFQCYSADHLEELSRQLFEYNPDIVILPQHEDRSPLNIELQRMVFDTLSPLDKNGLKAVVGYDTPMRVFNYNLFCPLTREQWQKVMRSMAVHVSQMQRVAYDTAVNAQARANAKLIRELIEPNLPERFEYVLMYQLRKMKKGGLVDFGAGERFVYYPEDIGSLKSFWPKNATITANAPHPDDTEIGLGAPFSVSAQSEFNNDILSVVATVGWRVVIDGVGNDDFDRKIGIRVAEAHNGANRLGITTEFLSHPNSLKGVGLPFYAYRVDGVMPVEQKQKLEREERALVSERLQARYSDHVRTKKDIFILCTPELSDKHPDHLISRAYWQDAAQEMTMQNDLTIMIQEFVSPWAGDFPAYIYSDEIYGIPSGSQESVLAEAARLTFEANSPPGGELILSGGFAGRPPKLPRFAQRFKIRRLKEIPKTSSAGDIPVGIWQENVTESTFAEIAAGLRKEFNDYQLPGFPRAYSIIYALFRIADTNEGNEVEKQALELITDIRRLYSGKNELRQVVSLIDYLLSLRRSQRTYGETPLKTEGLQKRSVFAVIDAAA